MDDLIDAMETLRGFFRSLPDDARRQLDQKWLEYLDENCTEDKRCIQCRYEEEMINRFEAAECERQWELSHSE